MQDNTSGVDIWLSETERNWCKLQVNVNVIIMFLAGAW